MRWLFQAAQAAPRDCVARSLRFRPARLWPLASAAALTGLGCGEITDPYPQPQPPNFTITATPAYGAVVPVSAAGQVVLEFDRPMERASVKGVQRVSFLLPLALDHFEGRWNATNTRVQFDLTEFPVQPGATYEARFVGLRSAAGTLYNGGPYEVRFRTGGAADLFPMQPHPRIATRVLCRRIGAELECRDATMHLESAGSDSLQVRSACDGCDGVRLDWFVRRDGRVEWLGWDDLDSNDALVRRVRWRQPPPLMAVPSSRGKTFESGWQASADGTQLARWRSVHAGSDSPATGVDVGGRTVEVVYSSSATIDLDYALRDPSGVVEAHLERWWLYPGVGVVRRDVRIQRDDGSAPERFVETLVPSLVNFVH